MKHQFLLTTLFLSLGMLFSSNATAAEPEQPTEAERQLANKTISDGNYRIYTEVAGTKYYLYTQDRNVFLTADKATASEYAFSYQTGLGKFADEAWRVCYNDSYRFSNGSNSASDSQDHLSMAESKNDRPDFERQVLFAREDANHSGEYVYAVRATNATCSDELVWQAWSKNCYWTVNTSASLPYPCYEVAQAGKGPFIWKLESTKESYAPVAVYNLGDLSEEEFAQNPTENGLWRFEKYNTAKGKYSLYTQYSDSSAANFVDVYQPCRVGGELIVDINGLLSTPVNNTYATNPRKGWSDYAVYSEGGVSNNSKDRFSYVVRDPKNGYEVYANDEFTSVISFVVPKDGFYQMDATVIRQDIPANMGMLSIVPRYRYNTAADMDYANPRYGMTPMFFGQPGGEVTGFVAGTAHINNGAQQRYIAQQPEQLSMAFEGKAGDIISFEVNADSTHVLSSWARDFYGRTVYNNLTISEVSETYAKQNPLFADTYGESELVNELMSMIEEYENFLGDVEFGTEYGQYSEELANSLSEMTGYIYEAIQKGQIHAFNAQSYYDDLQNAWRQFLESKVEVNFNVEGNYQLFSTDVVTGEIVFDENLMAFNDNNPWGFYYYEVANGQYHQFPNHDTGSKFGSSSNAWYNKSGDWLYISDGGSIHPMTNYAPSIMFTAPKDGVYKVDFSCFRPNPNASVENPLYVRARFMDSESTAQDKNVFMFAKEFGSVANDGQGGKAPIEMEYFVNMKAGDKITWDIDCYTSNRNSSAGTQVTRLSVCSMIDEDTPYTLEYAQASGIDVFDSYSVGDPTGLIAAIATAQTIIDDYKDVLGTDGGQYPADLHNQLVELVAAANAMVENGDTQYNMDLQVVALEKAVQAFLDSRLPYEIFVEGTYSINVLGTDKYLTRKNKNTNGSNYYAAFMNYEGVVADATKSGVEISEYNWNFDFKRITKQLPTGEYDEVTGDEITVSIEQISIYDAPGYMTIDGYVETSMNEMAAPGFRFFKYNADDEAIAIMNEDGRYWNSSISWKSPYDKINTTDTPNYVFVLSDMTLDKASGITMPSVADAVILSTEYYTISGAKSDRPQKGVNIRRQKLSDGRIITTKILVK